MMMMMTMEVVLAILKPCQQQHQLLFTTNRRWKKNKHLNKLRWEACLRMMSSGLLRLRTN